MGNVSFKAIQDDGDREASMPRRPSIRDIHVSGARRSVRRLRQNTVPATASGNARRGGSFLWWLLGASLLFVVLAAIFLFVSGKVKSTLFVRTATIPVTDNVVFNAYRNPEEGELPFVIFEKSATETATLPATETKYVESKASGTLVVYNTFRKTPQRIIKNTRFEAPDGKIYRVRHSFVIPGYSKKPDGTIEPGKVEITVYADRPGEAYNKEKAKFTLPGLKGDPRYDKIWAETKTPLTGGFAGIRPVVAEDVLRAQTTKLQNSLTDALFAEFKNDYGETYALFKDALFVTFSTEQTPQPAGDGVELSVTARALMVAFPMTELADELARQTGMELHPGDKRIVNVDELAFGIIQKENIDPQEDEIIQFTIDGIAKVHWVVDVEKVKEALVGKPKAEFQNIIKAEFPGVDHGTIEVRPFWRSNFPSNPEKIEVKLEFLEN